MNTERLIEGCKKNDRKAQEQLYRLLASKMLGVCLRYASSSFDAEEMLQAGFIKVFTHMHQYTGAGSFEGWVRRIMVNTAIEYCRKDIKMERIEQLGEQEHLYSGSVEINYLEAKDLMNMVQELAPGYRVIFNMYAIEGFSHKEIAETLNITESSSKSQLSRARVRLQEKIKQMEGAYYGIRK